MSRHDAAMHRRNTAKGFRSTYIPKRTDSTVDIDAIERKKPLHGYTSIFTGFLVTVVLVVIMIIIGLVAVSFS